MQARSGCHSHSSSNNKPIIITIIHTWKSFFQLLYIIKTPATQIWFTRAAKKYGSDGVSPS